MKQILTEEQWDKLSMKQKAEFNHYPVSIGDMIEYLGTDFRFITNNIHTWEVTGFDGAGTYHKAPELADALFEAVKYKLDKLL